jgi:phage regulator Rha-like protein
MIDIVEKRKGFKQLAKAIVSEYYNLDISKPTRLREYVIARMMFYKLLRANTNMTYQEIADTFDKNHATVLHSVKNLDGIMEYDYSIRSDYLSVNSKFNEALDRIYNGNLEDLQEAKEQSDEYYMLLNDLNKLKQRYEALAKIHRDLVESNSLLNDKYKKLKNKHEEREVYYRDNGFIIK